MLRLLLGLLVALPLLASCTAGRAPATDPGGPPASRPDTALARELARLTDGFEGEVGVYARHLPTGRTAEIRADEIFPTASMIKVPLLVALHDRVERGELKMTDELVFRDSLRYSEHDLLAKLRDGEKVPLSQLAFLMAALSDNTASLWIQALVGGGEEVNRWLADHGFERTRVNSRTPGRRPDWEAYGWGQTTPREIAELLVRIREGRAVSPAASEAMYRTLSSGGWSTVALAAVPHTVHAASKYGAVDRSRSEVLLVNAPGGDYVLAVLTKNQADESWEPGNAGWELIRAVSGAVYRHFNPGDRRAASGEVAR